MQFLLAAAPPHTANDGFVGVCGGAGLVVAWYSLAVSLQTVVMLQQGCMAHARDSRKGQRAQRWGQLSPPWCSKAQPQSGSRRHAFVTFVM